MVELVLTVGKETAAGELPVLLVESSPAAEVTAAGKAAVPMVVLALFEAEATMGISLV